MESTRYDIIRNKEADQLDLKLRIPFFLALGRYNLNFPGMDATKTLGTKLSEGIEMP